MRNFKKVVAAGLALLMLALSVNVSFAAENYTEKEAIVVAKVNAAGIMTGTDKGFEPSKTLTRAEAAAIFVRMKGISEDTVKQNAGATLFTDVAASHWAAGYVNVASNYSIIKGVGANKFAPEKEVTVAEFYTMAIRALNAGQLVEADGTWPTNYVNFAIENDLAEDVQQIYTAASTRMTAATIVANTLEATIWKKAGYKSNGEVEFTPTGGTVLASLNIEEKVNQSIEAIDTKKSKATVTAYGALTKFNERAGLANAKKGLAYTVWYDTKEKEVLGFWLPKDNKTVEFTDIKEFATSGDIKLVVDGEEEKFKGDSAKISLNEGSDLTVFTKGTLPTYGIAYYGTQDSNKDKIVRIYAETYTNWGVVKEIKNNTIRFKDLNGSNATTININEDDDSNYVYRVTKDGKEAKITDIEEDDVLFIHTNGTNAHDYTINVYENTVEGKVTAKAGNKVTIDGKKYELTSALTGARTVAAGDEGTLYLAENGKAVMFDKEKKSTDVLMISGMKLVKPTLVDGKNVLMIKYSTMDGTLSDWTEVNVKDSHSSFKTGATALGTCASDEFTTLTYSKVGTVAVYEKKSGKIVLKADTTDDDQEIVKFTAFTDGESIDKITTDGLGTYFLADDAVAYELDSNKKNNDELEITLKSINIEDLDTIPSGLTSYAVDLDKDQKTARVLIFDKTNIKSTKEWATVLEVAAYDDGDDDTSEDIQVTLLFAGEKEARDPYIAKKADLKVETHDLAAGDVAEFSITDNKLKSVKELFADTKLIANDKLGNVDVTSNKYLTKEYNNGALGIGAYTGASYTVSYVVTTDEAAVPGKTYYTDNTGATTTQWATGVYEQKITNPAASKSVEDTTYVFANDVIVVKLDKGEYKVSSKDALKLLDIKFGGVPSSAAEAASFNKDNLDGVSELSKVITWTEDGETTVIAVIYSAHSNSVN